MTRRRRNPGVGPASIAAAGVILAALITGFLAYCGRSPPPPPPPPTPTPTPPATARLEGVVVDRSGSPLGGLSVGVRNGPKIDVDTQGQFTLDNVPSGDQLIVVEAADGRGGQVTKLVRLEAGKATRTNVVYDAATSRLGLLSITAPLDRTTLEVPLVDNRRLVTVHGRCDGLAQILGSEIEVWVLVKPPGNQLYYVQHPEALIERSETWQADIYLGDPANPPTDGGRWTLIALAVKPSAGVKNIGAIASPAQVPQRISSNIVNFTSIIKDPRQTGATRVP